MSYVPSCAVVHKREALPIIKVNIVSHDLYIFISNIHFLCMI